MRTSWMIAVLLALVAARAAAMPSDLTAGALIVHCPPGLTYTAEPIDWCAVGRDSAITECSQQVTRVDVKTGVVWYVLACWNEPGRVWCGVEFGFGDYDPAIWALTASGPCGNPDTPLEIPNDGWPGPNKGTAIAWQGEPWRGNFRPVYYFAGYAYAPGEIQLTGNPVTRNAGCASCPEETENVTRISEGFDAVCLGKLGLFKDGAACCPPPAPRVVCCIGDSCIFVTEYECRQSRGRVRTEFERCDSSACVP